MNYNELLNLADESIKNLLEDILTNNSYKSPRAEERLTALLLSRKFLLEKIKEKNVDEVENEG